MSGNSPESPARPTAIHYGLVVVVLLCVTCALGWFVADRDRRKLVQRNQVLLDQNAQLENECLRLRQEVELQIEHRQKSEEQLKKPSEVPP
jgi:hypothetical protein